MTFLIFTQRASVRKLNRDSYDSDIENYVVHKTNLKLNIQPAGLEYSMTDPGGGIGKTFKCFTTWSGCQIGMQVVTSGTLTVSGMLYDVVGVEPWNGPIGRHYELLIRKSSR